MNNTRLTKGLTAIHNGAKPKEQEKPKETTTLEQPKEEIKPTETEKNPMAVMQGIFQETQEEKEEKFTQVTVYLNEDNLELFKAHFKKKGQKSEFINKMLDMYFEAMDLKKTLKRNRKK